MPEFFCWGFGQADDLSKCASDCSFTTPDGETIDYHSQCGTFNDKSSHRSLSVTEEEKERINGLLRAYGELDFPADASDLQAQYQKLAAAHGREPEQYRDLGELMTETQELIQLEDCQWYQSYVSSTADIRYILMSGAEAGNNILWGWYAIGSREDYSIHNYGIVYDDPSGGLAG